MKRDPQVFFTADQHYGHRNVIEYCNRPFVDDEAADAVTQMGWTMIERWNDVVKTGDLVYSLGDFALCSAEKATTIAKKLHGNKYYVFGNHDRTLRKSKEFCAEWLWCKDLAEIKVQEQKIVLCHFAMLTWNGAHRGAWQLHGHSHGSLPDDPNSLRLDVGVDCWDYGPVSFDRLKERMAEKKFSPVDHHGEPGDG